MYIPPTPKQVDDPSITNLLESLKQEIKRDINCVKIGVIQSFDAATQLAVVKIAFTQVTSIKADGTKTIAEYPLLLQVPVQFPSGGGFTLTFPVASGDECIVLFNDRQIDNWLVNGAGQPPTIGRLHDLSDGIAIVGIRSLPRVLSGVSTNSTQLRSDAGDTYVEVAAGTITLSAGTKVVIDSPEVEITASTQVTMDSPLVDITDRLDIDGINFVEHVHSDVESGASNTGQVVNP